MPQLCMLIQPKLFYAGLFRLSEASGGAVSSVFFSVTHPLIRAPPGARPSAWGIEGTKKPAEHPVRGLKPVHHL